MRHALLLVEDSSDDEALTLRAIKISGVPCTVQISRHGGDALEELLSSHTPSPHLVVLEFHLPGMNGLEILRELRKHDKTKHVPVVMLSSLATNRQVVDCLEGGASSFVEKPIDPEVYLDRVALIVRYWFTVDKRPERI